MIAYLFAKHRGTYLSPRITADLRALGWRVSKKTVAALMVEQGLVARRKRRRRGTTKPDKSARKAPDGLLRDFSPPAHGHGHRDWPVLLTRFTAMSGGIAWVSRAKYRSQYCRH
jgi:transposase InsO family protein